jgi:hypothetical protein
MKYRSTCLALGLAVLGLALLSGPAWAEGASGDTGRRVAAQRDAPLFAGPIFAATEPVVQSGVSAQGMCTSTADCADGTSVYCEGEQSGSCRYVDQDCSQGVRGYCTADGVPKYCPELAEVCPCIDGAACSNHDACGPGNCFHAMFCICPP